jgi:hypothetical protein
MANTTKKDSSYSRKEFRIQKNGYRTRTKGIKVGGSCTGYKNSIKIRGNRNLGMKKTTLAYERILEHEDYGINMAIAFLKSNKSK